MKRILLFAGLLFAVPLIAQSKASPFTLNAANQCARISVTGQATVGIQVTGTFSATLQPEVSIQGQAPANTQVAPSTSSTPQATITAAGVYTAGVAGFDTFLVCVSSYASGTATVYLTTTTAVSASAIVSSGGAVQSVIGTANQVASSGGANPVVSLPAAIVLPGTIAGTTQAPFSNNAQLGTTAYADNNFKGVSVAGFRDDFIANTISASITTSGVVVPSDSGAWLAEGIVGTGTLSQVAGTFLNPGEAILTTAATTGDGLFLAKQGGSTIASLGALGSNAGWEANFVVKINSTSNISMRVGFVTSAESNIDPPTGGLWVEYDTANANSNADFTWRTVSASTSNYSTVNAIAADTAFHHYKIRSTVAGTILFSVDGGTETPITTDVTTGAVTVFLQVLARANGAETLTIDFASYMASPGRT